MARLKWDERELPILEAIAGLEDDSGENVERIDTLVDLTGLERGDVVLGLRALVNAGYVDAIDASGPMVGNEGAEFLDIGLLERGRRAVGQWPSEDAGDDLLELIRQRAEGAATEEERSRLRRLLEAGKAVGGRTLTEIVVAYAKHYAGP